MHQIFENLPLQDIPTKNLYTYTACIRKNLIGRRRPMERKWNNVYIYTYVNIYSKFTITTTVYFSKININNLYKTENACYFFFRSTLYILYREHDSNFPKDLSIHEYIYLEVYVTLLDSWGGEKTKISGTFVEFGFTDRPLYGGNCVREF